jgi:NAD-dependent dihydropyrimidine dehydrogenase PreA subunit
MAIEKDIYVKLSEKVDVFGYPRYVKLLEAMLTPEEAKIIVEMSSGTPTAKLAQELGIDEKTLSAKVEDLVRKGCLQPRPTGYTVPQTPRFFYRRGDTPELQNLWHEFFHSGDYQKIHIDHINARRKRTGRRSHKIIPARQALLASPNLKKEDILWYEDMEQIFQKSSSRSQGGLKEDGTLEKNNGCGCRKFWGTCGAPGGCTGWEWAEGTWPTNDTVKYEQSRRGVGPRLQRRSISVEEAVKACDEMEDFGLVHISPNTGQITSTCNCCECDCEILGGMKRYGNIWEMLAPSRFKAVIDMEKCTGCQTCIERCLFDAIEMKKVPGAKKMKAFIIDEHCMGCGLCIFKCPNNAMRFEMVRPPDYIPTIPMNVMFGGR